MSIGLGKKYWVQVIDHFYGTIDACMDFIKEKNLEISSCWFELRAEIKVVKGVAYCTGFYSVDYVKDGNKK